jgi:hypothetical protein
MTLVTPLRLLLAGGVFALCGCVSTTVQEMRQATTGLEDGEAVVVLGRRHHAQTGTEDDFIRCVGRSMNAGRNGVAVISESDFIDALYPWFEPRTAPLEVTELQQLVRQPLLAEQLGTLGARYLIWIEGKTERTDQGGSWTCTISPAGAGCFGFLAWEDDSSYEANIWDLKSASTVGRISSDALGTSFMPAVVVPVPLIARVQATACAVLSDQLKTFLIDS